jgi:hypothetical protein
MRKPAGICWQVSIADMPSCGDQARDHNPVPTLFHIYVMPCCRGKRILGLGLPL